MFLTRLDRVVTSVGGKIVPTQQINVYQALDPSIIKTIDVHEGDAGQGRAAPGDTRPDLRGGRCATVEAASCELGGADRAR